MSKSSKHRDHTPRNDAKTRAKKKADGSGALPLDSEDDSESNAGIIASLLPPDVLPADGKLYYRIGEVSRITGVKPYVLRYWESEFRWMSPQKSRSKQRLYRRKDIEMILLIQKLLHEERFTIAGARKRLRELGIGRALEEAAESSARQKRSDSAPEQLSLDVGGSRAVDFCQSVRSELLAIREML
jgi:DNA-binding transcriptional MerR regulator